MRARLYEDDNGDQILGLDAEGIDYLIKGLTTLRELDPGNSLKTPSLVSSNEGELKGVGSFILMRVVDMEE